ncbi:MAG TPA: hypothetical protein VE776_14665, partial [Actinomycetota bacterium]|nr:hypothetical protein [Actinomycetota bacterium]
AAAWASRFTTGIRASSRHFRKHAAPSIVHDAVEGIAQACVRDPDERLRALLVDAIEECAVWVDRDRDGEVDPALWATACRLTRENRALKA